MEITIVYAIALGSVLLLPPLNNLLHWLLYLTSCTPSFIQQASRYLKYAYVIRRHRFVGPWTCADIIIQLVYIASNSFCLGFRVSSIKKAGLRAGHLSLINMIPLFLGPHLGFLADTLGMSLSMVRLMHRSAGLMTFGLILFHVLTLLFSHVAFHLRGIANLSAVVSGSSLVLMIILSWTWSPLRRWFYEIFLRSHQLLAAVVAISALLHVPSAPLPRVYFYISLGIFISNTAYEGFLLLYHNGVVARAKSRGLPRVIEVFKYPGEDIDSPIQLTIRPQEPLSMKAGQYINLYLPSLGIRPWIFMQSHPFVVVSWTGKRQTKLELLIQPRRGWTRVLESRAITTSGHTGGLGRVLFTGPHGTIIPIDNYEYVSMVASGYGIIAQLPLLQRLVQGTLAREVRARRICLFWEFEDISLFNAVRPLFNWVLVEDRKLGDNYSLSITLYTTPLVPAKLSKRANILPAPLPTEHILRSEIKEIENGKMQDNESIWKMEDKRVAEIKRGRDEIIFGRSSKEVHESASLPVYTSAPKMLITVSASSKIRDELRLPAFRLAVRDGIDIVQIAEVDLKKFDLLREQLEPNLWAPELEAIRSGTQLAIKRAGLCRSHL